MSCIVKFPQSTQSLKGLVCFPCIDLPYKVNLYFWSYFKMTYIYSKKDHETSCKQKARLYQRSPRFQPLLKNMLVKLDPIGCMGLEYLPTLGTRWKIAKFKGKWLNGLVNIPYMDPFGGEHEKSLKFHHPVPVTYRLAHQDQHEWKEQPSIRALACPPDDQKTWKNTPWWPPSWPNLIYPVATSLVRSFFLKIF